MTDNNKTCIDLYLDAFAESCAAANYKADTLKNYRTILRKVGGTMDAEGIEPSALTPDQAERVGRMVPLKHGSSIRPHNLARRFAQYLIDIGVVQPAPLTEAKRRWSNTTITGFEDPCYSACSLARLSLSRFRLSLVV